MTPQQLLLGQLPGTKYAEACEVFGSFHSPEWRELMFGSGDVRLSTSTMSMAFVRLAVFDLDFESAIYAQVWDHLEAETEWRHLMFFNTGRNEWVPEVIYVWGERPSFQVVGDVLDSYLRARPAT